MDTLTSAHNVFLMIPAYVANHPKVDDATAILFGRLNSLSNSRGYCFATDKYLSEISKCGDRVITNRLKKLINLGFIKIVTNKNGMKWERKIWTCNHYVMMGKEDNSINVCEGNNSSRKGTAVPLREERLCPSEGNGRAHYIDNKEIYKEEYKKKDIKEKSASPPPPSFSSADKEEKQAYGEMQKVRLTHAELSKLKEKLGERKTREYIERLDLYIAQKGKSYKSHSASILIWAKKDSAPEQKQSNFEEDTGNEMDERPETTKQTHANMVKIFIKDNLEITGGSEIIVDKNGLKISYPTSDALHGFKTYHMPLPSSPKEMLKSLARFQGIAFTCSQKLKDMCSS